MGEPMPPVLGSKAGKIALTAVVAIAVIGLCVFLGSRKNLQPRHYFQLAIDGIRGGSIYALLALGFVAVYSVTGIINFAQGEFVMLGAMICISVNNSALPLPPAVITATFVSAMMSPVKHARSRPRVFQGA